MCSMKKKNQTNQEVVEKLTKNIDYNIYTEKKSGDWSSNT